MEFEGVLEGLARALVKVVEVPGDRFFSVCVEERFEFGDAVEIGGGLGVEIGEIVFDISSGEGGLDEKAANGVEVGFVVAEEVGGRDDDAFFGEAGGMGGHGAGGDAADFRVVSAIGDEGDNVVVAVVDGTDERDIGEMGAAESGMIGDDHVAWRKRD